MKSSIRRVTTSGLVLLLVLIAVARVSTPASASAAGEQIVMFVPGIPGSSTLANHFNWIDLSSFAGNAVPGGSPCQMVVQKPLDMASPHLWVATVTGQVFTDIRIQLIKPGATGAPFVLYDIQLETAQFTAIGDSASNALAQESLTFRAVKVMLTFNRQNPTGAVTPITTTFNC